MRSLDVKILDAIELLARGEAPASPALPTGIGDRGVKYEAQPLALGDRGYVDDVIDPRDTRRVLVRSLEMLRTKKESLPQRKHGNVPL